MAQPIEAGLDLAKFTQRVELFLGNNPAEEAPRFSAQEYFTMLLEKGLEARDRGNYGIAAAYIVRSNGVELICFGANKLISEGDPNGHAEVTAFQNALKILHLEEEELDQYLLEQVQAGNVIIREAPHDHTETLLFTTLEPCPMCAITSINARVDKVIIATPDDSAGGLDPERFPTAPLWEQIRQAQDMEMVYTQSEDPSGEHYLPQELKDLLNSLFFDTRESIDAHLSTHGFFNYPKLGQIAAAFATAHPDLVRNGHRGNNHQ